jgi:acyl-[acyl-carrier-protein]-phospholipid O-acyltransferase/long-chain-fatty-acid--[acyl-carrier-protein] ligase
MPQFLLRMLFRIMLDTIYRLNIYNAERLPESGPALLVANRASFVDILFISACTSRPIRFMMHEHYYRVPILHTLYKSIGFLEVPSKRVQKHKELIQTTRDLLRNGELICVFPEDDITRNGTMSSFRNGIGNWLPEEKDIPVIPMRIGMTWGSIFSCSHDGRFKLRFPGLRRHPASVTIGNPIPRETNAYEMRIIMAELGAETELIPDRSAKPLHTLFCNQAKRNPRGRIFSECTVPKWKKPSNFSVFMKSVFISRYLRRNPAENEGDYVGVMLPNSIDFAIAMLGTQMANKTPAILNYTAGTNANAIAIEKANLKRIITRKDIFEKSGIQTDAQIIYIDEIKKRGCTWWSKFCWYIAATLFPADELMKQISPENWNDVNKIGVLIFSSGSTGIPKGIMLTHHNIIADVLSISSSINYRKNDGVVGNLPLFHSFGMAVCFWMPIVTGTRTVLIPNALDAASVAESMKHGNLSILCATPGFLQLYMRRCVPEDFKNIRLVITGAEKLRDDVAEKFRNMTGLGITEAYGCTELSPVVSINLAASVNEMGTHVVEPGSIGPPLIGVCAKVVDPSTFELRDENTDGLLIVKGAIVMKGYLGEPEKTKEVIRDGWYITGDIARMSRRGFITITGRLSRFSKIAGEMVPHELVEREMNNILCPEDRLLAVCGATDAAKGEKLIVFYCDRERLAPEQLVKRLRERGIPNLWIPKPENFIYIEKLPFLGNGKLDLAQLKTEAEKYNS